MTAAVCGSLAAGKRERRLAAPAAAAVVAVVVPSMDNSSARVLYADLNPDRFGEKVKSTSTNIIIIIIVDQLHSRLWWRKRNCGTGRYSNGYYFYGRRRRRRRRRQRPYEQRAQHHFQRKNLAASRQQLLLLLLRLLLLPPFPITPLSTLRTSLVDCVDLWAAVGVGRPLGPLCIGPKSRGGHRNNNQTATKVLLLLFTTQEAL
jgi:hypothetical protein